MSHWLPEGQGPELLQDAQPSPTLPSLSIVRSAPEIPEEDIRAVAVFVSISLHSAGSLLARFH